MSVRCITRVLDSSQHAGTDLLMLVVLADYSDDDGNSYPSVASLARKCRMTGRNANFILGRLQLSGELRVLKNEGPRGTNRYRLMLDVLGPYPLKPPSGVKQPSGVKPASGPPEAGFPKPLKPASPEPSLNRQEPSREARKRAGLLLSEWIEEQKTRNDSKLLEGAGGQLQRYAQKTGIPEAFISLAWSVFKAKYTTHPTASSKRYSDWRAVFENAIREGWSPRLWHTDRGGQYVLSTQGVQSAREHGMHHLCPGAASPFDNAI